MDDYDDGYDPLEGCSGELNDFDFDCEEVYREFDIDLEDVCSELEFNDYYYDPTEGCSELNDFDFDPVDVCSDDYDYDPLDYDEEHHSQIRDTRTLEAPRGMHKHVIGKQGANIKNLKRSFPKVSVNCHVNEDKITITGPSADIAIVSQRIHSQYISVYANPNRAEIEIQIEPYFIGAIIGKRGKHIKDLQRETESRIHIDSNTNTIRIVGLMKNVLEAKKRIESRVDAFETTIMKNLNKENYSHPEYLKLTIKCTPKELSEVSANIAKYRALFPKLMIELHKNQNLIDIRGKKNDAREVKEDILKKYVSK